MGRKWGVEDPPEEAYSRVTNPERFLPLHGSVERLLGRLEATFDVEREEGYAPVCGCDACDETAEQEQARLESMVGDLTTGRLTESIRLRLWGDGWLVRGAPDPHEVSRIGRARARALIARTGGRRRFDYRPWPRRSSAPPA